ncbi:dTDP-4-dehydrorhamnose reductase [Paenibacillus sp. MER 180]|uniref:dTDP-4-dehydrorhamnose reductase n=1 Tax=Paenibacillus sp. MER 180 TaxID=2939570 RepID=UPI002041731C|nr:dTDP-4-dehydrorhamnose reductase [Paenibacillus sp. MER 180]MCM3288515.1 dTDP-4-dehydrorhamnose reductase [Paenibacillus sp. MER 180]
MKILVTGVKGQLGSDVARFFVQKEHEVFGMSRDDMDITDSNQCHSVVTLLSPDVIIHCAAYTAVDKAEQDIVEAYRVNADGTRNLAAIAEKMGIKFCYVSTDYVFDGTATQPYHEYDNTNPVTIYGKSKRAGEILTQSLCSRYYIVRTSWVYGSNGNNFVKTMIKLGKELNELKVVSDQVGSPTYTEDLAYFIEQLIGTDKYGIYHASNQGQCSWYDFACAIFEEKSINITVHPCTTEEFPRPAPRPRFSVMEHMSIKSNNFVDLPPWRESLVKFLGKYID